MKKKILSVFLTVAMMLSMATAFAGTISASDVDLTDGIDNYEELEAFVNSLATKDYAGETVKLNANITVNEGWVANDGTSTAQLLLPVITLRLWIPLWKPMPSREPLTVTTTLSAVFI